MSTNIPTRKSVDTPSAPTTLPRQRTHTPVPSRHHGKVTFAIVSLLAGGVGVAALWIGIGAGDEVQAPAPGPTQVTSNTDASANAFEHRMQEQAGQGQSSTNAVESANQYNLSPLDWERSLDGLNRRAQAQAEAPGDTDGQSSVNALEQRVSSGAGYQTPQELAEAHHQLP